MLGLDAGLVTIAVHADENNPAASPDPNGVERSGGRQPAGPEGVPPLKTVGSGTGTDPPGRSASRLAAPRCRKAASVSLPLLYSPDRGDVSQGALGGHPGRPVPRPVESRSGEGTSRTYSAHRRRVGAVGTQRGLPTSHGTSRRGLLTLCRILCL